MSEAHEGCVSEHRPQATTGDTRWASRNGHSLSSTVGALLHSSAGAALPSTGSKVNQVGQQERT